MRVTLSTGTPAEVARRQSDDSDRVLVVYPDIFGLRPLFDDMTAWLGEQLRRPVVCVEMFPGLDPQTPLEDRHKAAANLNDSDKIADLHAAAAAVSATQISALGFCMGGMYALKAAAEVDRTVAFYGMVRLPEPWRGPGQRDAIDYVRGYGARVLSIMGGRDPFTPASDIEDLKATGAEVVVYPEAEHGFVHDSSRPSHRADDASDAWRRALEFLA